MNMATKTGQGMRRWLACVLMTMLACYPVTNIEAIVSIPPYDGNTNHYLNGNRQWATPNYSSGSATNVNWVASGTTNSTLPGKAEVHALQVTNHIIAKNISVNRALITDGTSFVTNSATTASELAFVSGVTSAIQGQIDLKAPLTSAQLVTPNIGVATATTVNKVTITQPASAATLTIVDGKTATVNNSITFAGTDATTQTFPSTSGTVFSSATKADVLDAGFFAADAGANDTYTATLSPAITAYVTGSHYRFKANTANTGAASINLNSLGAKTIVKVTAGITTTLADNDIRSGQWVEMAYDGTNMQMLSMLGNVPAGSGETSGTVHSAGDLTADNAIVRVDGTTGTNVQKSVVLVSDSGAITGVDSIVGTNNISAGSFTTTGTGPGGLTLWDNAGTHHNRITPPTTVTTNVNWILLSQPDTGLMLATLSAGTNETVSLVPTGAGITTWLTTPTLVNLNSAVTSGTLFSSVTKADVLDAAMFAADAGANDTYTATLSPAITAYVTGSHYRFKANTANTGAASINLNSLGAKTIKKAVGGVTTDVADNDIRAGQWVDVVYDGTNMQMQSLLGNAGAGTGDALVANPLSQFAATTSAQLFGVISDESGSGVVAGTVSPVFTTPDIGAASGTSLTMSGGVYSGSAASLLNAGGIATVVNNSSTRLSSVEIKGGTGAESSITLNAGNRLRSLIDSNGVFNVYSGSSVLPFSTATNYTATPTNSLIVATATVTITLPAANGVVNGWQLEVKNTTGTTTIGRNGGDTIDGTAANDSLVSKGSRRYRSDGASNWHVVGVSAPPITDITGLGSNMATFLATPSSANLRAALTDETGSSTAMFTRVGVWRNMTIPSDGWMINRTNSATAATNTYTGTGYFDVPLYSFADLQTNRITRQFEMPEAWDAGTVKFKFHWSCTNTSGNVAWFVHGKVIPDNGDPNTAWGTSVSIADTAQTASRPLFSGATGAMTFGGTPAAGGLAILEVYRDAGDGSDTLAGSAELWSINMGYTESATEPAAW